LWAAGKAADSLNVRTIPSITLSCREHRRVLDFERSGDGQARSQYGADR
jgi:hypothetical protein